MNRDDYVLVSMAMAGRDPLSPVQVQKYFFLLDRNVPKDVAGGHFNFRPHDYGPFDKEVYRTLSALQARGLVEIDPPNGHGVRRYRLSETGAREAVELLERVPESIKRYAREVADWIRPLSFTQVVSAIYAQYPEMKVNSVFRESARA